MELFIKLRKERFLGRGGLKMRESTDKSAPWVSMIKQGRAIVQVQYTLNNNSYKLID